MLVITHFNEYCPAKEKRQILFLHGYLCSGECFYNQLFYFSKYYDCFAPTLTGFNGGALMQKPYSLDDYCNEVKEYMQKNEIIKPIVVAHSFGARIAVKMAGERYRESEPFSKIILTGPAGLKPRFSLKKFAKKTVYKALKNRLSESQKSKFYSADYKVLSPVMKQSFNLLINEHLEEYAKNIFVPTLIIEGAKDKETPPYQAKRYNRLIKGSRLVTFSDVGHFAFLDAVGKFNATMLDFIENNC